MMYNNKLAVAIKSGGRVLREFGDKVYVPFGTEYTILIKNLHTTRAVVNISIDGTKATENGLVIDAGKEIELERFLKTDLNKGNKFKFIERSNIIEKSRGIKLEDGLVVIDYQFETDVMALLGGSHFHYHYKIGNYHEPKNWQTYYSGVNLSSNTVYGAKIGGMGGGGGGTYSCSTPTCDAAPADTVTTCYNATVSPQNENGITVPGSISEQKFHQTYVGVLEATKHSMVIKLLGETDDNKPVSRPVTVNLKPKCVTCSKINKATSKFCSSCGTSLQILA